MIDNIIGALLVVNPMIPGLYSLLDYIGYVYDNLTIRIAYGYASIFINLLYVVLYVYLIHSMITNNVDEGFEHDRKLTLIFSVISSVVLLTIFFLRYYSFKSMKQMCKKFRKVRRQEESLWLINLEKTSILVSFLFVLYFVYNSYKSGKKYINGHNHTSITLVSIYYTLTLLIILILIKTFELNSLIKEDVENHYKCKNKKK